MGWGPSPAGGGGGSGLQIVDLGLVDLVTAVMGGPQTLLDMPAGSYLASIRFTDDPETVQIDNFPTSATANLNEPLIAIGTVKSFGWSGFAWAIYPGLISATADSFPLGSVGRAYGPYAALDTGANDFDSLVLSAATVGPIEIGVLLSDKTVGSYGGKGAGVRVAAITAWEAATAYDSPASNTVATPGVLQKCTIVENGTIWFNDGTSGTSGGTAPDFVDNAGGSVADGDDIVWYDTSTAPPTIGQVHAIAELWTPS